VVVGILSPNDVAALELAADLLAQHDRAGLADRLRRLARAGPEPDRARRPAGEVQAIAQQVRALDDLGVYTLFMDAQAFSPTLLTARVHARAERAMRRRQSNT
jgi:hypothetical protein